MPLTALAWRGSYLSHNSIFKEHQSVSTQKFMLKLRTSIPLPGNKNPSADWLLLDSAAQFRVLGRRDYLFRIDCQLCFLSLSHPRCYAEDRQIISREIIRKTFVIWLWGVPQTPPALLPFSLRFAKWKNISQKVFGVASSCTKSTTSWICNRNKQSSFASLQIASMVTPTRRAWREPSFSTSFSRPIFSNSWSMRKLGGV